MLEDKTANKVPSVTFKTQRNHQWVDITSDDIFNNKTVIVFSLPGAYTPTCSSSHLPRFNELAPIFKENGVDEIVCISVNDTFVMNEWKKDQEAENITMLPDGNGEFTDGMGMLIDKNHLGFGKRSWRYSMLIKNGIIEKMFIEPEVEGDPFEVSDADTMLNYINPNAIVPKTATLFSRKGCPHCKRAIDLLEKHKIYVEIIELGKGITSRSLNAVSGKSTTPQIFIGGKYIGGADELEQYFKGE
ncbi:MAG: glutathione peroxidase [Gammaproteobacteria bacterium]|uniref:Glutaredoxin family protein n=1 Tax=endosymbiont of Bathymodiolus septemdierum str. Myojin knoll TaxID=1303921 RepID=A0A0P0UR61_9GAMM|nr:glutathione peroxidase [Bathymodiolus septemdierum thioautotrophic gill symbiont]RUA05563.1 MAG: glutathione peroxidase [Gammaproteobacteria bacterium]BAS67428.1 glutaredoxin family protein [endosymbiont of Bathymodiolus septemdierum str. Myojin knoll]